MESAIYLVLTVGVLIGAPLWMFRHDIAARCRGISYMDYLREQIDALSKKMVTDAIRRASYLHPRPEVLRRKARNAAIACLVELAVGVLAALFARAHPWAVHVFEFGLGAATGSIGVSVWFAFKARAQ